QTDQAFYIHRPILAGDILRSEASIDSIRQVRGNDFISVKATVLDQEDRVVQVGSTTIVARPGVKMEAEVARVVEGVIMHRGDFATDPDVLRPISTEEAAAEPPLSQTRAALPIDTEPQFDELSAGDPLPARTMRLTRGDLVNYAGVAGDPNPIHFSDRAAELAGLPTVVAHGMLTMGLGAEYLASWLGDPGAIASYSVRFAGFVPVPPLSPAELEFTGKIKSLDPERRTATVLLNATAEDKKLFGRAMAEVQLS
ncbi:MAG: MaoC family dehydratase N-terminal domain-containing protein, partial [Nocardia sp.]|nr:MaoC family dehydratase N-terminal domain-containing protein [Nocardia sp.]